MINRLNTSDRKNYCWLVEFFNENRNYDFYFTSDNSRKYITDEKSLRELFRNSEFVYTLIDRGDYVGVILVWKSIGGGKVRYYVKLNAKTSDIARDLITVLLWNCDRELFFKIRKDSLFLNVIKKKGFRFFGGRGSQILLKGKSKSCIKMTQGKDKEN